MAGWAHHRWIRSGDQHVHNSLSRRHPECVLVASGPRRVQPADARPLGNRFWRPTFSHSLLKDCYDHQGAHCCCPMPLCGGRTPRYHPFLTQLGFSPRPEQVAAWTRGCVSSNVARPGCWRPGTVRSGRGAMWVWGPVWGWMWGWVCGRLCAGLSVCWAGCVWGWLCGYVCGWVLGWVCG